MSAQNWVEAVSQVAIYQTAEHRRAIATLEELFANKVDADTAARTIASIYEPLIVRERATSSVATFWSILCNATRVLGGQRQIAESQVNILNSISLLPDVKDDSGNAITPSWKSAGVYWRDLPELAMIFRDEGIDIEPLDEVNSNEWETHASALLNATKFGAVYFSHGKKAIGMAFQAEIGLMRGIEMGHKTIDQQKSADVFVPPAAAWILLAGESIFRLCKTGQDRKDGSAGSLPFEADWLWNGHRGYSLERWAFWNDRFHEIAENKALGKNVNASAASAAERMNEIKSIEN